MGLITLLMVITLFYHYAVASVWWISFATMLLVLTKVCGLSTGLLFSWGLFVLFSFITTPVIRQKLISKHIFSWFKKIKPEMSSTEREALEAGSVTWEGDLFSGAPDFEKLLAQPAAHINEEEQAFLDNEVEQLCEMLDEWEITHHRLDLPENVWQFIKEQGFFGMIIPKAYGGREFSATAISRILIKLYSQSISCATTVSVPNSLGPGELLLKYGTQEQKDYYLPRLANGKEIPCFALTGPTAGSDAASIPDTGIVCHGVFEDKEVLGIRLNWNKRYITLSPVATLIGLAFNLKDPDALIGDVVDIGITCALIPASLNGVTTGRRHFPLNTAFMNGPTQGENVFIPLDYIIGGREMAGLGWRMLMECLGAGRAVSLPSSSVGSVKAGAIAIGAYARIRKQFDVSIADFEGIEEPLARIAGETYFLSAASRMTIASVDAGEEPAVASAIMKYHSTQGARRVSVDAMDIVGGKGICLGPNNFVGRPYQNAPIAVTVEGANILTRCLIMFGQGAIRCHPYVYEELQSAEQDDLMRFDKVFWHHVRHFISNTVRSLLLGATDGRMKRYHKDPLKRVIQLSVRYSTHLAFLADFSMMYLGAQLKFKEKVSGRLADMMSMLYLTSGVIKQFHDDGRPNEDWPLVQWSYEHLLYECEKAMVEIIDNFKSRFARAILTGILLPSGRRRQRPLDHLGSKLARILSTQNSARKRLAQDVYLKPTQGNILAEIEDAFMQVCASEGIDRKIRKAHKKGEITGNTIFEQINMAFEKGLISKEEKEKIASAEEARAKIIAVDDFSTQELQSTGVA